MRKSKVNWRPPPSPTAAGRAIRGRAKCFTPSTHSCSGRSVARGPPASPSFLPLSPSLSLAFLTPYFISGGGGGGAAAVYRVRPPKSRDMKYNRAIRAHVFFRELLFRTSHSHSLARHEQIGRTTSSSPNAKKTRRAAKFSVSNPISLPRCHERRASSLAFCSHRTYVYPSFRLRGQVDSQCKSCLVTDNFPQQICQGNIKTERNNRITLMHIQEMGSSQFGGKNIETVHAKLNIDI